MKAKIIICSMITLSLLLTSVNIYANNYGYNGYNYDFENSYNDTQFGDDSSSNINVNYTDIQNIRRNKDTSHMPTAYGHFSGVYETDLASPYHKSVLDSEDNIYVETQLPVYKENTDVTFLPPTSTLLNVNADSSNSNVYINYGNGELDNNHTYINKIYTVETYSDGSIGSLYIPAINLNQKVYRGTTSADLRKGIGHFDETSEWDGNVALASHNRGSYAYFGDIHKLNNGDIIRYSTKEGRKQYEVYNVFKISETDMSVLKYSYSDMITLITCVRDESEYRWCVQARIVE